MELNLVDLILSQGPAYVMAAIFAYLYLQERKENARLHRTLYRTLAVIAQLPDMSEDDTVFEVDTLDIKKPEKVFDK
jgi:hypothetical protein